MMPAPEERRRKGSVPVRALLATAVARLRRGSVPEPRLEAEVLLAHVLECSRAHLVAADREPVAADRVARVERLVGRRARGTPLQYLTGVQEFRSLEFQVDRRVLIPRPETEEVVEACLQVAPRPAPRIVDVGTGSGCIAVSLARELPGAVITAIDSSPGALEVAAANAARLVAGVPVRFLEGDLLGPLEGGDPLDLVVSNPPYVAAGELPQLQREVRDHEPREALVAGTDGLAIVRRLVRDAPGVLGPGGWLVMELGFGQWETVRRLVAADGRYEDPEVRADRRGIPRVLLARRRQGAS